MKTVIMLKSGLATEAVYCLGDVFHIHKDLPVFRKKKKEEREAL